MKKNVLITGTSSGLGLSLSKIFKNNGYSVYGISKSKTPLEMKSIQLDFFKLSFMTEEEIEDVLFDLIGNNNDFDYVFLNAGTIEPIEKAKDIGLVDLRRAFEVNVMSSKTIIDFLLNNGNNVKNIISISSGAANKPYDGWLSYCMVKSALKQMISCYAIENPDIHFLSLAPGVMKTKMQNYLLTKDANKFNSLKKFHNMYDFLPSSDKIAQKIFNNLSFLSSCESGSFFDLRTIVGE